MRLHPSSYGNNTPVQRPELVKLNEQLGHVEKKLKMHGESMDKLQKELVKQVRRDLHIKIGRR